ncbi:MAG: ABC transporter permease [Spirochaetaceae bacterium]|nr:MAG: ABC transporter permease [Spirochaetaceae bacterium]
MTVFKSSRTGHHRTYAGLRMLAVLAAKNLTRYRRRTLITVSAIAFGVAIFIGMASMLDGLIAEGDRNLVRYETASAAITGTGYWDEREQYPLDITVADVDAVVSALEDGDIAAAPRVGFRGELIVHYDPYPEDGSVHLNMYGIDPERDARVFHLADALIEGQFLDPGEHGILISAWLAERLGAEVGYPVTITTRTRDGFHQILDMDIVGIYETPNPTVDRSAIYMPLDIADFYLEMRGAVTAIHLALPEPVPGAADLQPVRAALERAGVNLTESPAAGDGGPQSSAIELLSFDEMTAEFAAAMELQDAAFAVVLLLLGVIAVVGISNTMLMAVLEREREIGMMRALGMRNGEIRSMFVFESAGIGLIGAAIGLLLGAALVWYLTAHGIDYSAVLADVEMDFRFDGVLYGVWSPRTMITAAVGAAVLAGAVALLPVRRILRRGISDSLRQH